MKLMQMVLVLAGLMAASAYAVEGNAEAGKSIAGGVCAGCHGADGNSAIPSFPKLAGQSAAYTAGQLDAFKSGDRADNNSGMAAKAEGLSEQDIADVAAFYAEQTVQPGQAKADLVELGEKVFRGGNMETGLPACSGCHGPAGSGLSAAGFPALGGQHAAYTAAQLKAFRAAGRDDDEGNRRDNDENAMMRSVAAKMSDKEIAAVASFLEGLSE